MPCSFCIVCTGSKKIVLSFLLNRPEVMI
jgi:hypothetical protein